MPNLHSIQITKGMCMLGHYLKNCDRTTACLVDAGALKTLARPNKAEWKALSRVRSIVSQGGNPIAEQLEMVGSLPMDEQMAAAVAVLRSWVHD